MKRFFCALVVMGFSAPSFAEDVWVQVRDSKVRNQPQFYAPSVASVRYGDRLSKLGDDRGWASVSLGSTKGYIPLSTISRQQIVLSARDVSKVQADASDVVLAGKGFSKEIEQSFKKQDSSARFDLVDKVEGAARVSSQDVAQFAQKGGLVK